MSVARDERPLIGSSGAMQAVIRYADKVALTDSTVLITGETGTGKENLAHLIHRRSARRERPLLCINCAAVPEGLLEGEMFGYERGAFTGAASSYPGKLSLAEGGTVFLDEVAELAPAGQAKLLRVLESGEVFRLGASRPHSIDVRMIAATNQELEPLVERGAFRRDLFFRLNVARVHLPPLRARREDIADLLAYFVRAMSARTGVQLGPLAPETLGTLTRYVWPGNVRELRNVVEALFIDPPTGLIEPSHLPPNLQRMLGSAEHPSVDERDRILGALVATRWNKSRAADHLHWSRMTLYRKMVKHGIGRDVLPEAPSAAPLGPVARPT
jgi:transcriptional regulator with PAS, ATPase and Fis domain